MLSDSACPDCRRGLNINTIAKKRPSSAQMSSGPARLSVGRQLLREAKRLLWMFLYLWVLVVLRDKPLLVHRCWHSGRSSLMREPEGQT